MLSKEEIEEYLNRIYLHNGPWRKDSIRAILEEMDERSSQRSYDSGFDSGYEAADPLY